MRSSPLFGGLIFLFCCCAQLFAQDTPRDLIAAYVGPNGISDKANVYTGEMLQYVESPTLGQALTPGVRVTTREILATPRRAVFGTVLETDKSSEDWYLYVVQDGGRWKLQAIRRLVISGLQVEMLRLLTDKQTRTSQEEWDFQNLSLVVSIDVALKKFLQSHTDQFDRVVALAISGNKEEAIATAKSAYVSTVQMSSDGRVELVIGGLLDNAVGFMFVPNGAAPPPIDPADYIYVERVTGNWYIFKTT